MRIRFPIRGLLLAAVLIALGAAPVAAAAPYGESPAIAWQKLLGGNGTDEGCDARQTSDGGYILLGSSASSASGDVTGTNHGYYDFWVVKVDSAGTVQWQKLLGGIEGDFAHSVQQTSDGGYVLLGSSYSSASGDVTGTNHGWFDYWVVKLDSAGTVQWQKLLGGIEGDWGSSVQQTSDGGYVLLGSSYSSASGDVAGTNHGIGLLDCWVVKLDGAGTVQWQKLLGGSGDDYGLSAQQTSDGGYVLLGASMSSASGDVAGTTHGDFDYWAVKLDGAGAIQWQTLLGGSGRDAGGSVQQTVDGGYVLLGSSDSSASGDVVGANHGGYDVWMVKLNGAGAIQWQKLLGGSGDDYGSSVSPASDGGYVLFGGSSSANGDVTGTPHGNFDYWVVKLDGAGAIRWQKLLGGSGDERGYAVLQTADGAYVLFGYSESSASGDVTGAAHGGRDLWMVKLTMAKELRLSPGWNFVSVPAVLAAGSDTAAIFAGVDTDGHSIFLYNATTKAWTAMTASTEVKALDGIWIYSAAATAVTLAFDTNPQAVPPAKDLAAGWNSIGYASTGSATARDALSPVTGKWSTLLGYDATLQRYELPIYTGGSEDYSDLRALLAGRGYWLWMREPGQLSGPGV